MQYKQHYFSYKHGKMIAQSFIWPLCIECPFYLLKLSLSDLPLILDTSIGILRDVHFPSSASDVGAFTCSFLAMSNSNFVN